MKKKGLFFTSLFLTGVAFLSLQGKTKAKISTIMSSLPEGASVEFLRKGSEKNIDIYWQKPHSCSMDVVKKLTGMAIGVAGVVIAAADYEASEETFHLRTASLSDTDGYGETMAHYFNLDAVSMRQLTQAALLGFSSCYFLSSYYNLLKGHSKWERCLWATLSKSGITLENKKLLWQEIKGLALSTDGSKLTFVGNQEDYTCNQMECPIPFGALLECLKIYIPVFVERCIYY